MTGNMFSELWFLKHSSLLEKYSKYNFVQTSEATLDQQVSRRSVASGNFNRQIYKSITVDSTTTGHYLTSNPSLQLVFV